MLASATGRTEWRTTITPPQCCGRQHDPNEACDLEGALRVFTVSRSPGQAAADHLETVTVTAYRFHRPLHRRVRHRPRAEVGERLVGRDVPPTASPRTLSVSLPLAIAVLVAFLAANLVVTVLIATGLH